MNETMAQERVDMILLELEVENNANFCDLVQNYSSDFGSVANCGEYTFGRGQMVPEFEEAGYDMVPGELRVVQTTYGFHIMLKVEDIPEGQMQLNESISGMEGSPTLYEGISQVIVEEKAQEIFSTYVAELSENAEITYFDPIEEEISEEDFKPIEISLDDLEITENDSEIVLEDEMNQEIVIEDEMDEEIPLNDSMEEEAPEIIEIAEFNETNPVES
jgi:hypothetical protein